MRRIARVMLMCSLGAALSVPIGAGIAAANPSPNGPGQPGAPTTTCGSPGATANPGGTATVNSPGSPFNPNGVSGGKYANSTTPGSHAISQYDIACYQVTQH